MKFFRVSASVVVLCSLLLSGASSCDKSKGQRVITILATNDIHGGVESAPDKTGKKIGGMALLSGAVHAIRSGLEAKAPGKSGVVLVDAGDQFQGTLLSNFDEGQVVFAAMNQAGYDAVVPGNHDYDFGPIGWLEDKVGPTSTDKNPRGAIEKLARQAAFPLIAANVLHRDSIVDFKGAPVPVRGGRCAPEQKGAEIDWQKARRPGFLTPYVLKTVADVRVALIGLDNQETSTTTTPENVSDLCFRDEAEAYLDVRAELEGKADVFVLVVHDGNSDNEFGASNLVKKILAGNKAGVHAVIAGHTHFINNTSVDGVPIIQSGSGGDMFGRIDLVYDFGTGAVTEEIRKFAGIKLDPVKCSPSVASFCKEAPASVEYEGVDASADPKVLDLIAQARKAIAPLAGRVLGEADGRLTRNRTAESSLMDFITDVFRKASNAEVAMINTAGLRDDILPGPVTYEDFFRVIPFGNKGVVVGPMPAEKLLKVLERSTKTCGGFGALLQSGLRVTYQRDCKNQVNGADPKAHLVHVETLSGEVILDTEKGIRPEPGRTFQVATLDFILAGGSGFDGFIGVPVIRDLGILREAMVESFLTEPFRAHAQMDGRWKQVQ